MNRDAAEALGKLVTYSSWTEIMDTADENGGWLPGWTVRRAKPSRHIPVVCQRNAAMADYEQYLEPLP